MSRGDSWELSRAPEPTDISWENMAIGPCERVCRGSCSYFFTGILVAIAFWIIGSVKNYQKDFLADEAEKVEKMTAVERAKYNDKLTNKYQGTAVSTMLAGFIQVINMVMILIVREFSLFERHETKTKMNISLSFKLGFMRFMTSSICYLLVHKNAYDWYVGADLVYDVSMILFFLAANPIIMLFCDIDVMMKRFTRWREQGKGDDCQLT